MTNPERAQALAGDMPWITANLTPAQQEDFVAQIRAALDAAVVDAFLAPASDLDDILARVGANAGTPRPFLELLRPRATPEAVKRETAQECK